MREAIDRRVLGAIEFIDAVTAARVREPLRVAPADARTRIAANRSALYVIHSARGLEHQLGDFDQAPSTPATESLSFELTVTDPARRYLPRLVRIKLPRKQAPASDAQSVLNPIVVPLYPSPAASVGSHWAVLRLRVQTADGSQRGLANALVSITPQLEAIPPVTAVTDGQGEALAAITGVAQILPGAGADAVLTREFSAGVQLVLDKRVVRMSAQSDAGADVLLDPQRVLADRASGHHDIVVRPQTSVSLSAGKSVRLTVETAWP